MTLFSKRSRAAAPVLALHSPLDLPVVDDLATTDTTGWPGCEELERQALACLCHPDAIRYVPDSAGSATARRVLSTFQEPRDPARWILTASSSEAYSILFQLLCDPGEKVAVPRPGYPLIEELGRFQMVSGSTIPLRWSQGRWNLDLGWLERRLREGVRALVLIQPANPTGWVLSPGERRSVLDLCRHHRVPIISDEVFEAWADPSFESLATQDEVLCFTLGGLSKLLGLPHLKLGWIRLSGPSSDVLEARARLEMLNDALLSASTPVQCALPDLLAHREAFQGRIRHRLSENRIAWSRFQTRLPSSFQALDATSGWFGLVQWSAPHSEEWIQRRLAERGVKVLPGYLFDLPSAGLVVSLIADPGQFIHGLSVLSDFFISLELEQ